MAIVGEFCYLALEFGNLRSNVVNSVDIDSFDRRLLAIVRRNNLMPARVIAQEVGLSESAVLRRLRRLRSIGVIVADISVVDTTRLAASITIHILVELNQSGIRAEQAFAKKLERQPEVVAAWNVTGRTDFVLTVNVPSIEAYQVFSDEVLASDENVRDFETLVSLREIVRPDPLRAGDPI